MFTNFTFKSHDLFQALQKVNKSKNFHHYPKHSEDLAKMQNIYMTVRSVNIKEKSSGDTRQS